MARRIGTAKLGGLDADIRIEGTWDPRHYIPTHADLLAFTEVDKIPNYFIVTVGADPDPSKNGTYECLDKTKMYLAESWRKIGGANIVPFMMQADFTKGTIVSTDTGLWQAKENLFYVLNEPFQNNEDWEQVAKWSPRQEGYYYLVQPDGTYVYGNDAQELMDIAEPNAVLTLNHHTTGILIHRNRVAINTNGFDLHNLKDSETSGAFSVYGGGRIGRALIGQFNSSFVHVGSTDTEIYIDCELNVFTRSADLADGSLDSKFSCKSVVITKPVVLNLAGWLQFWGPTNAAILEGAYQVNRENAALTGNGIGICSRAGFSGTIYARGNFHMHTDHAPVACLNHAGGTIILEGANLVNRRPPTYIASGIFHADLATTKIILRGLTTINTLGPAILKDGTNNLVIDLEGEVHYVTANQGPVTFNRVATLSTGGGMSQEDADARYWQKFFTDEQTSSGFSSDLKTRTILGMSPVSGGGQAGLSISFTGETGKYIAGIEGKTEVVLKKLHDEVQTHGSNPFPSLAARKFLTGNNTVVPDLAAEVVPVLNANDEPAILLRLKGNNGVRVEFEFRSDGKIYVNGVEYGTPGN